MLSNRPYIHTLTSLINPTPHHTHLISSRPLFSHSFFYPCRLHVIHTSLLQTLVYPLLIYTYMYVQCMLLFSCSCVCILYSVYKQHNTHSQIQNLSSATYLYFFVNFTLETFTIINCSLYLELNHFK